MVSMLRFVALLLVVCPIFIFLPSEISYSFIRQSNSAVTPRASSISTVGSNLNIIVSLCMFDSKSCQTGSLP
jgi:hypothetical protein